ncbi:PQQ-binding-like beta-propeller repeat protein [Actinoplanes sp. CA-030573]|uniref:outer membrane protein assembly factor BamB family protein n=1 Tax=Actinoplanes sp. CA-030573 TaxID=3239898 RepID=UPI003D8B2FDC
MTLIDLGDVTHEQEAPPFPVDRRRVLRALLAALTVAGLVVLAGSAHAAPLGVRRLWTVTDFTEGDNFALGPDTLYVDRLEGGRDSVAAYDLATGAPRWIVGTGAESGGYGPALAGDTVLAQADPLRINRKDKDGNIYSFERIGTTVALDAASGRELWRADGEARASAATGTALVTESDNEGRTIRLSLRRLRTGEEIWNHPTAALTDWTVLPDDGDPEMVVLVTPDGRTTVLRYADGRVLSDGRLPWPVRTNAALLWPVGRFLAVIRDVTDTDGTTTVYDPRTLRALWTAAYVSSCGPLLCSVEVRGVSGRDPVTGHERWNVFPGRDVREVAGDRLAISTNVDEPTVQLVDARTGRALGPPVKGDIAYTTEVTDSVLLLRPSVKPVGSVVVVRLHLRDGSTDVLGSFTPAGEQQTCAANARYLVCPRGDGLHVMAVG